MRAELHPHPSPATTLPFAAGLGLYERTRCLRIQSATPVNTGVRVVATEPRFVMKCTWRQILTPPARGLIHREGGAHRPSGWLHHWNRGDLAEQRGDGSEYCVVGMSCASSKSSCRTTLTFRERQKLSRSTWSSILILCPLGSLSSTRSSRAHVQCRAMNVAASSTCFHTASVEFDLRPASRGAANNQSGIGT